MADIDPKRCLVTLKGMASTLPVNTYADFDLTMWDQFHAGRSQQHDEQDAGAELQDLVKKHRQEQDAKKRLTIAHEWARQMALYMPTVPYPGESTYFGLNWP